MTGMREVIYSKFSNERARAFSTRTDLIEEDGKREVIKTALYPEGEEHIRRLADLYLGAVPEDPLPGQPVRCPSGQEERTA